MKLAMKVEVEEIMYIRMLLLRLEMYVHIPVCVYKERTNRHIIYSLYVRYPACYLLVPTQEVTSRKNRPQVVYIMWSVNNKFNVYFPRAPSLPPYSLVNLQFHI